MQRRSVNVTIGNQTLQFTHQRNYRSQNGKSRGEMWVPDNPFLFQTLVGNSQMVAGSRSTTPHISVYGNDPGNLHATFERRPQGRVHRRSSQNPFVGRFAGALWNERLKHINQMHTTHKSKKTEQHASVMKKKLQLSRLRRSVSQSKWMKTKKPMSARKQIQHTRNKRMIAKLEKAIKNHENDVEFKKELKTMREYLASLRRAIPQ